MIWGEKALFSETPKCFRIKKEIWHRQFMRLQLLGGTIVVNKFCIWTTRCAFYQSWFSNIQNCSVSNPFLEIFSNVLRELKQRLGGEVGMRTRAAWFVGIRRRCWSLGNWTWAVSKSRGATMVKGTRISWTEKKYTCYKMPQAYACGWICIYIYINM